VTTGLAEAFDRAAEGYDAGLRENPVWLLFRHSVQERLRRLFPRGAHVLDMGCGTGEDALLLAEAGVRVCAIDVSPGMVAKAREKARESKIPSSLLSFQVRAAEDVAGIEQSFDGAYSNFGALNCGDLTAVGRGLVRVLKPGAPMLLSWMGPRPLPSLLRHGPRARRGSKPPRVGGTPIPVRYPTLREVRRLMGSDCIWRDSFGLGVTLPAPEFPAWPLRHPGLLGVLAGLESVVRHWPILRGLGDHLVLEGLRR
jgi:SAM-dependent methyltransferase